MSNLPNRAIVDRPQRFALNGQSLARVIVLRSECTTPPQVHGTLENSSHSGVRLRLDDCIPCGETATLRIFYDDNVGNHDGELELEIKVCWCRPTDDGKWTTGCDCVTDLSDDVCAMFADRGEIERRRAARRPTRLVAMARWELNLGERPIEITDASQTGFAFRAATMGSTGDRLLVRLTTVHGEEVIMAAKLRWKANTDSGYLGGCGLVNEEDYACLMPFIDDEKSEKPPRSRTPSQHQRSRRPVSLAFAATAFLMFMGPSVLVLPLLQANRKERVIPINMYEPPEATAETRLAQVDLDSPPASGDRATRVVPPPAPARSIDLPAPVSPPAAVPQDQPLENEDVGEKTSRDDQWPVVNDASSPTVVRDRRPSERAEPDATPTDDHTANRPSADDVPNVVNPLVEGTTPVETQDESTVAAPTGDVPVEPVPGKSNLSDMGTPSDMGTEETVRSDVPPGVIRLPEAEIVTLAEAIDDSPTVAPATVAPPSVAPVAVESDGSNPDVADHVAIRPIIDELVIATPDVASAVITPSTQRRAVAEFNRGREALAAGDSSDALAAFAEATASSPDVALYQYHWALALHLTDQSEAAVARVAEAARVEHEHGVENWGKVMQRVQGRPRVWLERARRQALAGG